MPNDYPESEFPWTFYFNGETMPRWTNCWGACDMFHLVSKEIDEWDQRITSHDLVMLYRRIDHVGSVESEERGRFQVLALTLIEAMMTSEAAILAAISRCEWVRDRGFNTKDIYHGVLDGLFKMVQLTERDGMSFWIAGHPTDRDHLLEFIRRTKLPQEHPDHYDSPHIRTDRLGAQFRYEQLRKEIIGVVHASGVPKDARRQVHELPHHQELRNQRP